MTQESSFNRSGEFFTSAFNQLERASERQERSQAKGLGITRYDSNYDTNYFGGVTPPAKGPFGEDNLQEEDVSALKEDLLSIAKEKRRPSGGSVVLRAGGGTNPAVRG
jgi:hypothetical protein